MTLADTLTRLTDEHDLHALSVGVTRMSDDRRAHYTAYAHFRGILRECTSAHADTPEEAVMKAVAEANALRGRGIEELAPMEFAA